MKLSISIILIVLTISSTVVSWHETGHMVTAAIAEQILLKEAPEVLTKANELLSLFKEWTGEADQPFIEAATWPDKIKEDNNKMMEDWHFISQYHSVDGTPVDDLLPHGPLTPNNVTQQITGAVRSLQWDASNDSKSPFYGHQDARFMKSFSLRNLIHFVGDVHQPLHSSEGVSAKHKKGDRGGNSVKINMKGDFAGTNLHFFWDHLFYNFSRDGKDAGELTSPLTDANKTFPQKYAKSIMKAFPRSKYPKDLWWKTDPMMWAAESLDIATKFVYKGITEKKPFTAAYVTKARKICLERLALGGYRLAEAMKWAFKDAVKKDKEYKENLEKMTFKSKSFYINKVKKAMK